jgi:hypothetical protein
VLLSRDYAYRPMDRHKKRSPRTGDVHTHPRPSQLIILDSAPKGYLELGHHASGMETQAIPQTAKEMRAKLKRKGIAYRSDTPPRRDVIG